MLKRILLIFLLITGLYIIVSNFPVLSWLGFYNQDTVAKVSDKIDMIELQTSSMQTTIIPEDRDDVSVDYNGKGTVAIDKGGNKIEVNAKGPRFNFFSFNKNNDLKIYIPEDYDRNMEIKVGSGSLDFSGESETKPMKLDELKLNVGSGKMELENLEVNHVDHDGSSGLVVVKSIVTKTGSFNMSSGKLDITHYSGALNAELSSGIMNIAMDELPGPVKIKVSSGKVNLDIPTDADFTLNGKTNSGNINNEFSLTDGTSGKNSIIGKHGSGEHKIDLDVSSGIINIR